MSDRLSQTLLSHADSCPLSAVFYRTVKRPSTHAQMRGTAFHETVAALTRMALSNGESRVPGELGKAELAHQLDAHPEWVVPVSEADSLRLMVWQWCEATVIDPEAVLAVEAEATLGLGDHVLSGRLDLVLREDADTVRIRDYKTSLALPSQEQFEGSFQLPTYALLAAFGDVGPAPLAERATYFVCENVYPRYSHDGQLASRQMVLTRSDLSEHRAHLERLAARTAKELEAGTAVAIPGSHCGICPAPDQCPLTDAARRNAGATDVSDPVELAERWLFVKAGADEAWKRLRAHADEHGPIRFGEDLMLEFRRQESRKVRDWDALEAAIVAAVELGEPFSAADHIKVSDSTRFSKRKLSKAEVTNV